MIGSFGSFQHPTETHASFKECPAVHALEIDRRAFDVVIDFQSVGFIGKSFQLLGHLDHALTHRKFPPLSLDGLSSDAVELGLPLESRGKGEVFTRGKGEWHEEQDTKNDAHYIGYERISDSAQIENGDVSPEYMLS